MKKNFKLKFKNKKIIVKNYIVCDRWYSKMRGLMFRPVNFKTPLDFVFERPGRYSIHSFFCRKFIAFWFLKGRVIDVKIVEPWQLDVTPKVKFDELLEIPLISDDVRNI